MMSVNAGSNAAAASRDGQRRLARRFEREMPGAKVNVDGLVGGIGTMPMGLEAWRKNR
jgi:hypothetical protein